MRIMTLLSMWTLTLGLSAGLYVTQLPTIIGIGMALQNAATSRDVYLDEMCLVDVTVDCTTKKSTPASRAMAPNRSASCGVEETAAATFPALISSIRFPIKCSLMGSLYIPCI